MTQQVTHKVTQHLTGASYGENVKLLNSMIQVRRLKKKNKHNKTVVGEMPNNMYVCIYVCMFTFYINICMLH